MKDQNMKSLNMNKLSPIRASATKLLAATVALLALAAALPAWAERDKDSDNEQSEHLRPVVPVALQVPAGQELTFQATGVGVQIYVWTQNPTNPALFSWVFKAPEAVLLDEDGEVVGHHYAGPTWESNDGSKVVGARVAGVTVDATAVPWLLLKAKANSGPGIFAHVSYIQRLETVGGIAPPTAGVHAGDEARVPYTAEYYFYQRGGMIYKTGFEAPTFVAGTSLVGQDGWVVGQTPDGPLSPNAPVISTGHPRIGRQTVRVLGADLVHQDFIGQVSGGYYDAIGSYRHPVNYDTGGQVAVRISALVRVDGPQTATGNNFFSASVGARALLTDGNGTAGVGELDLSSDGHVYGWSGDAFAPTFQIGVPVTLGEWHELAVVADFVASTYAFFVDDEYLGTFPFPAQPCGPCFTNTLLRGSLLASAGPDTASNKKADYAAHYDNFAIQVVSGGEGDKD